MKQASIISIGNEIITGQIIDSNAAYLSQSLINIGIPTIGIHQVGDDIDLIVDTMRQTAQSADIIFITGGLGPTDDDVTRQAVAKYLGVELELRQDLLKGIQEFFQKRSIQMAHMNTRQAYLPAGSEPLQNAMGTAPGIISRCKGKLIAVMPGVPGEMKKMFEQSVLPELRKFGNGQFIIIRKLRCFGTGESQLAQMLGDMMNRKRNPQINCTVSFGVITLHIIATSTDESEAMQMARRDELDLKNILGNLVYGTGEETLAEVVGGQLAENKKTLSLAESCTGGLVAKLITDVPGSSQYFKSGWVTYSNEAKISELGVSLQLLQNYGAVSQQVAAAMADGARRKAQTDYAISITGIAGPEGGTEQKPVGLVYIGVSSAQDCSVQRFVFSSDREFIRLRAALTALNLLRLKMLI